MDKCLEELKKVLPSEQIRENELMCKHTTFRVGGPADIYLHVHNKDELIKVIKICKENDRRYLIKGNGSNLLVGDEGFRGVVIKLTGEFREFDMNDNSNEGSCFVTAGAGAPLSKLSVKLCRKGYTGLEFAAGIPGTVGGAVVMNAGAFDGEIKDNLIVVTVLTKDGQIKTYTKDELKFGYRHSLLQETGEIVLDASFLFSIESKILIYAVLESFKKRRMESQPLDMPSAGSTFKRPEGTCSGKLYAGKLIDEAGLKGYTIGGAMVSEKHAGFIVNKGDATAKDILELIEYVQKVVNWKFGIFLEPEIEIVKE